MLPKRVAEFLERPTGGVVGTRSAGLVPSVHPFCTGYAKDDGHVTALIPAFAMGRLREAVDDSWLAVTLGDWRTHETYQFKGPVVEIRDGTPLEQPYVQRFLDMIRGVVTAMGFAPEQLAKLSDADFARIYAVTIRVEEAYNQTPGPGAGERLS